MMSSVSCVASTAPWPARAWSEGACVIRALSTGRVGSIGKAPGLQQTPDGVGTRISSGRIVVGKAFADRRQRTAMATPIFLSSGDVIADRRLEWARDREAKGDPAGAAELLMQALELAPGYASAWFALGELREGLGDRKGAIAAFE